MQASNSLLKFLEEPPEDVIGILTSHHLSNILDTIQSRTQIISLRPAGRKIRQEQILELIDDERERLCLLIMALINRIPPEYCVKIDCLKCRRRQKSF